jgi:serine protease inhibitor
LTAKQANAPVSSILLSIISTVFVDIRWKTPFELNDTEPAVFHGDQGDATVPFMHQRCEDVSYLCDETFVWERVDIPFYDGSELRIVLPAPRTLETLVHDLIALRRAFSTGLAVTIPQADKQELTGMDRLKAKLAARKNPASMPIYANTVTATVALLRFEIDSTINGRTLVSILRSLGITDAFDPTHADFTGICEGALAISRIMQGTHIEVNEHGARAAVYTGTSVPGAVPQWGPEITFTVDRPFMYALMTRDRLPLFVGAVRNL